MYWYTAFSFSSRTQKEKYVQNVEYKYKGFLLVFSQSFYSFHSVYKETVLQNGEHSSLSNTVVYNVQNLEFRSAIVLKGHFTPK